MRIRYTGRAAGDLEAVYAYLDERSPSAALRVKQTIHKLIEGLADFPEAGAPTDIAGVRGLFAGRFPYFIFYRPMGEEILTSGMPIVARGAAAPNSQA